jgi:hypothetical protein
MLNRVNLLLLYIPFNSVKKSFELGSPGHVNVLSGTELNLLYLFNLHLLFFSLRSRLVPDVYLKSLHVYEKLYVTL